MRASYVETRAMLLRDLLATGLTPHDWERLNGVRHGSTWKWLDGIEDMPHHIFDRLWAKRRGPEGD